MLNTMFSPILLVFPSHDLHQAGNVTYSVNNRHNWVRFTCTPDSYTWLHDFLVGTHHHDTNIAIHIGNLLGFFLIMYNSMFYGHLFSGNLKKQDRQCVYNITVRCVRKSLPWKSNKHYMSVRACRCPGVWACACEWACSFAYPAFNAYAL